VVSIPDGWDRLIDAGNIHNLELAAAICDRTGVMYAGQVVEVRESNKLHDQPLHPYTAALLSAGSMKWRPWSVNFSTTTDVA